MRILNIAGMSLIALTHLLFLCFIVHEFCRTLRGKKHRADVPVFEGFAAAEEDEPYIPKLSADALQKLLPARGLRCQNDCHDIASLFDNKKYNQDKKLQFGIHSAPR